MQKNFQTILVPSDSVGNLSWSRFDPVDNHSRDDHSCSCDDANHDEHSYDCDDANHDDFPARSMASEPYWTLKKGQIHFHDKIRFPRHNFFREVPHE